MRRFAILVFCLFTCAISAQAQRGGADWMTDNGDAQRSAWIRSDAKISNDSLAKPGFAFLWKIKTKNIPNQLNSLTPPSTLERLIGFRGFRMLGFFAGSGDNLYTIDTDLGRMEWERHLSTSKPAGAGSLSCPGGMTTSVVRPTLTAILPAPGGAGGFGRSNPAKSAVGDAGAGAVTLANVRPNPPGPPPTAAPATPPRTNRANPAGGGFGAGPFLVYALASDGNLHSMHLSNGQEYQAPIKLLSPGANASGLIVVENAAYAVTSNSCNGVANGLWAVDLDSKQISSWKGNIVGSAGPAFGSDGTIFVTTGSGGEAANSIVAIDPKTLKTKSSYSAGQEFVSSPVVFDHKGKLMVAAQTKDGRVHLLDAANLSAAVSTTAATGKDASAGSLASWQDTNGTRWILTAHEGALPAGFTSAGEAATKGAILAWKVVEAGGKVSLQPGWASRNLVSPLTPTIINGVVFATSSGEFKTSDSKVPATIRAARSGKAVLYALDGPTGKELWNSGTTITSFAHGGALSGGIGQIYLTTHDGTIYAFGFPMEH